MAFLAFAAGNDKMQKIAKNTKELKICLKLFVCLTQLNIFLRHLIFVFVANCARIRSVCLYVFSGKLSVQMSVPADIAVLVFTIAMLNLNLNPVLSRR